MSLILSFNQALSVWILDVLCLMYYLTYELFSVITFEEKQMPVQFNLGLDGLEEQRVVYVNPTLTPHSPPKLLISSLVGDEYFQETLNLKIESFFLNKIITCIFEILRSSYFPLLGLDML